MRDLEIWILKGVLYELFDFLERIVFPFQMFLE